MITILMKITTQAGSIVMGNSELPGHYKDWILVKSLGFNIQNGLESEDKDKGKQTGTKTEEPVKADAKKEDRKQTISISKTVDKSTVYLMQESAKDRSRSKSDPRSAIICLLENRSMDSKGTSELFPFLQIKLGSVEIPTWGINATSDSSGADESFDLHFKQMAMVYFSPYGSASNKNAKNSYRYGPTAWDEKERKEWDEGKGDWYNKL